MWLFLSQTTLPSHYCTVFYNMSTETQKFPDWKKKKLYSLRGKFEAHWRILFVTAYSNSSTSPLPEIFSELLRPKAMLLGEKWETVMAVWYFKIQWYRKLLKIFLIISIGSTIICLKMPLNCGLNVQWKWPLERRPYFKNKIYSVVLHYDEQNKLDLN